ncbi:MAG TPA: RHS repeat-associated core domain-containing protein [Amycolatopsis sp.]|uniref:RHS repeat-associated core domain-containing protein n=1 Tax=Amycolatopsis sp. TaxID=37632 RepID=UPI002B47EBF0|nr:RHS repeat-associated core domain-containing protein [Amycolatopsis sp.]HKS47836.1 RHS repeat-associated core domain-containing protein [Amycolatopsis sp.]
MSNPLVAQKQDSTTWHSGINVLDDAAGVYEGVQSGSWIEGGIAAFGTGMDLLTMAMNPVGTLISYGLNWLIEHVKPLQEALNKLAGDADQIAAYSATWKNIATAVQKAAKDLTDTVNTDTANWTGTAADTYRANIKNKIDHLGAAATCAETISTVVQIVGVITGAVRGMVRDMVTQAIGDIIQDALEEVCTLGLGTPVVVAQVVEQVSAWIEKIGALIKKLINSVEALRPLMSKLEEIFGAIKKVMSALHGHTGEEPHLKAGDDGTHISSADDTPTTHAGDPTTSSSTDGPAGDSSATSSAGDPSATSGEGDGSPNGGPNRPEDPAKADKPSQDLNTCNDPVDVASGQVVMAQTDLALDGVLPLVLRRVHLSSYRAGRRFGPSWASTLDQRLEFDGQGVVFLGEDGIRLVYPDPPADGQVEPDFGPRWPLFRVEDGGFAVAQRESGLTLRFAAASAGVAELQAVVDRNGNRYDLERDDAGVVSAVRHSGGYTVLVGTENGLVTELRLANPSGEDVTIVRFGYNDAGRLAEVVNSSDLPLKFEYDHVGRLMRWTDRNGMWYRYRYDGQGRCVANQGAGGYLDGTFTYDHAPDGSGTTRFTDALGDTTVYHLNHLGQTVAETDPLGHTTTFERDARGRVLTLTDPMGRVRRNEYDEDGNLVRVTMPDGTQALAEYNALGLPLTQVDPDGAVWRYAYDERGNTVATTDPAGNVTRYAHDDTGAVTRRIDALGGATVTVNNAAGLPVAVTDPVGATVRHSRDQLGRLASVTDPLGNTTALTWSVEGRLLSRTRTGGGTERWLYDAEGCMTAYTDAGGNVIRREIIGFDLVAADIDATGARTEYTYDAALRLTAVTNAEGLVWRYGYDQAGNLVRETDFNGRVVTYEHDAAGEVTRRTNGAGQSVWLTRDAMGRVIERRTEDAVTTFEFDPAGRLRRAVNPDAELVVRRDVLGDVVAETVNGRTVASRYDALGRRTERLTPTGARSSWEYDPAGRAVRLHSGGRTVSFGYDPVGRETERLLDTGAMLAQTWDGNDRLVSQTVSTVAGLGPAAQARLVQQRTYRHRPGDRLTAVEDRLSGTRRFTLDPHGRITGVESAGHVERYSYDRAGNLTDAYWPGDPEPQAQGPRQYQGTLLRAAGNRTYHYDAQGRVVARTRTRLSRKPDTWHFTWDAEDRLTAVRTPDGSVWRYRYDPLGRRIAKQRLAADGSVAEQTLFAWDGVQLAEQVHSGGHATTWDLDPKGLQPLTQIERMPMKDAPQSWVDAAFYAIVTDLVGAPAELVDPYGNVAWHAQATVWGQALGRLTHRAATPLRFPGQYHDPETGLHYNHYRYYDPENARYISSDPLGLGAGPNPRGYVGNPHRLADPLGLVMCDEQARRVLRETDPYDPEQAARRSEAWRQLYGEAEPSIDETRRGLVNQARNAVRRGAGIPNELDGARVDIPRDGGSQIHVQGRGNGSGGLNYDGSFRHSDPDWNRRTYQWLYDHGFAWPTGGRFGGQSPGTHEW